MCKGRTSLQGDEWQTTDKSHFRLFIFDEFHQPNEAVGEMGQSKHSVSKMRENKETVKGKSFGNRETI